MTPVWRQSSRDIINILDATGKDFVVCRASSLARSLCDFVMQDTRNAFGEAADADGPLLLLSFSPDGSSCWRFLDALTHISDLSMEGGIAAAFALEHVPLIPLARCLLNEGRSALMKRLHELSPESKPLELHSIVESLTRAVRHGALTTRGEIPIDYECAATRMPCALRRAIVDAALSKEVSPDDALVAELNATLEPKRARRDGMEVLKRKRAISAAGCAALRACVDAERSRTCDSVDQLAEHQLNCTRERLVELIGMESARALFALPDDLFALRHQAALRRRESRQKAAAQVSRAAEESGEPAAASGETEASPSSMTHNPAPRVTGMAAPPPQACQGGESSDTASDSDTGEGGYYVDMFIRRYTRDTRPWIGFHCDVSTVTANVALNDDDDFEGGR